MSSTLDGDKYQPKSGDGRVNDLRTYGFIVFSSQMLKFSHQHSKVDPESYDNRIAACPLCRSMEYIFEFDEEMEQYIVEHGISHERSRLARQTLHLRLLYICLTGVNDAYLIDDLDHDMNKVMVDDIGPFQCRTRTWCAPARYAS
ncbi:hypothetical protein AJ80_03977 [Polytolypa hystricis UAMH7299]|uniref:Uncharacterized protein n=1 Tax=Polytolypa hystricis (strain UAMH7299) TaxID=1447883 RepID=A0A2B7YFF6_POLH7|nr:hypothetical protein AJ80_03977 [Polytolypa hystricis UAMH7299]